MPDNKVEICRLSDLKLSVRLDGEEVALLDNPPTMQALSKAFKAAVHRATEALEEELEELEENARPAPLEEC